MLALIGVTLLSTSLGIRLSSPNVEHGPLIGTTDAVRVIGSWGEPASCESCGGEDMIDIRYPAQMRLNESSVVEVSLASSGVGIHGPIRDIRTKKSISLILSGAGFDVAPSATIAKPVGSPLPVIWSWTIAPKRTGRHSLLLNLEDLGLEEYRDTATSGQTYLSFEINDHEREGVIVSQLRDVKLSIVVLTQEGLVDTTSSYINYTLTILGFFMLYPAVAERVTAVLKRRESKRKRRSSP